MDFKTKLRDILFTDEERIAYAYFKRHGIIIKTNDNLKDAVEAYNKFEHKDVHKIVYKATDENMKCHNYKYIMGMNDYNDDIEMCESGFHACYRIENIIIYKNIITSRIFKCDIVEDENWQETFASYSNVPVDDIDKTVTAHLDILEELSREEVILCYIEHCSSYQLLSCMGITKGLVSKALDNCRNNFNIDSIASLGDADNEEIFFIQLCKTYLKEMYKHTYTEGILSVVFDRGYGQYIDRKREIIREFSVLLSATSIKDDDLRYNTVIETIFK